MTLEGHSIVDKRFHLCSLIPVNEKKFVHSQRSINMKTIRYVLGIDTAGGDEIYIHELDC
jgi:hypothetical protein